MTGAMRAIGFLGVLLFLAFWMHGCASSPDLEASGSFHNPPDDSLSRNIPLQPHQIHNQENFAQQLPLGLGGRFDLMVADTASNISDFYDNVIDPARSGKLFSRTPYQLNYSLYPRKGEAFSNTRNSSELKSIKIRSDYKFQVGFVRRFSNFSDFLNPDFWIASGEFTPPPPTQMSLPDPLVKTLGSDTDWQPTADAPFDMDTLIRDSAGLSEIATTPEIPSPEDSQ